MAPARYPIRAVARLTGLSIDTLRAWERRYQAVQPLRGERGRLYSESDIERLKLLRAVVALGHPIGQAVHYRDQQLAALMARPVADQAVLKPDNARLATGLALLQPLLTALDAFNGRQVEQELTRLATLLPPRELIYQVAQPLLQLVGESWQRGELSIAQEHLITALLRNQLGTLLRLHQRGGEAETLLFATPSGELHEFGILLAAMLAAVQGLRVVYLGVNLPNDEIIAAARRSGATVIVLALLATTGIKEPLKNFRVLAAKLPDRVELWVGGSRAPRLTREIANSGALLLADLPAFEQRLRLLTANR